MINNVAGKSAQKIFRDNKNGNKMILHLVTFGLFTVLQWCYTVLLLKHILKIGLAGEAEKVTDFNQAFVAVGQKAFRLF